FHESCFEYVMRRPPLSTPSPYTTLFRSFEHGVLLANAGLPTPWDALRAAAAEQGERFMAAPLGEAHAWLGADIMMGPDAPGTQVLVARRLDDSFAGTLSLHEGVQLRIRNYRQFQSGPEDAFSALHTAALVDGRFAV